MRLITQGCELQPFRKALAKEDVYIINNLLARAVHLFQSPVFSIARDTEGHLPFTPARFSVVVMADFRDYRSFEREFFGITIVIMPSTVK